MKTGFGIIWVCLKQDSPKFDDESDESDESAESDESSNSHNVVAIWLRNSPFSDTPMFHPSFKP